MDMIVEREIEDHRNGSNGANGHGSDPKIRLKALEDRQTVVEEQTHRLNRAHEQRRADIRLLTAQFKANEAATKEAGAKMVAASKELGTQVMGLYAATKELSKDVSRLSYSKVIWPFVAVALLIVADVVSRIYFNK